MKGASARLAELDALRGVAVLLVLAYHYTTRFGELFPQAAWGSFPLGNYGVHLFFVISGFVIFMTLERSERGMDFVVGRFSRLYPAYWTAIVATSAVLLVIAGPVRPPSVTQALVNLTMLHGFIGVPSVDGVYWSLEVELLFYALALGAFRAGLLPRAEMLVAAWLALAALYASPWWPAHLARLAGAAVLARLLILEFAPLFAIGILLYRLYRGAGKPAAIYPLLAAAFVLVLCVEPPAVSLLIVAGALVLWRVGRGGTALLRTPLLLFFGTISYSLYLLHQKIGHAVLLWLADQGWSAPARIALAAATCIALATALTFLVERPAMAAIRRWYRRSPRRQAVAGTTVTRASHT